MSFLIRIERLVVVAIALTLLAPSVVAAQAPPALGKTAATCAGAAAWFAAVPEPDALNSRLSAASVDSSGTNWSGQLSIYNSVISSLEALTVPDGAAAAQSQLLAGFKSLASSASVWVQGQQNSPYGIIQDIAIILNADVAQSNGRNAVIDGYRLRADFAEACAIGPGATTGAGCAAVTAWMIPAESYIKNLWDVRAQAIADQQTRQQKNAADPGNVSIGATMAPWESLTNYFYAQALALAVIPAPAEAVAVKQETVSQLAGWSDLYLLGLLGIWNGFLGADAATTQKVTDAYAQQTTALSTAYATLLSDWAALATACGSTILLPAAP